MTKPTNRGNGSPHRVPILSGGNPQIGMGHGDAPVAAYLKAIPDRWKRDIAKRLDALVVRHVAGVKKAVKWNSPFYGMDGTTWFLSFHMFDKYVKVTWFKGTQLTPPPAGTSKVPDVRYSDIREGELDEAQLTKWIAQAAALPGEKL
jgi:hypothetical protein